eukprot:SAG11_NODE_846_length_6884_cov_5.651732_5_plen_65_part_00
MTQPVSHIIVSRTPDIIHTGWTDIVTGGLIDAGWMGMHYFLINDHGGGLEDWNHPYHPVCAREH